MYDPHKTQGNSELAKKYKAAIILVLHDEIKNKKIMKIIIIQNL